eukprot:9469789-Pyramimonas_sp.AAC.1
MLSPRVLVAIPRHVEMLNLPLGTMARFPGLVELTSNITDILVDPGDSDTGIVRLLRRCVEFHHQTLQPGAVHAAARPGLLDAAAGANLSRAKGLARATHDELRSSQAPREMALGNFFSRTRPDNDKGILAHQGRRALGGGAAVRRNITATAGTCVELANWGGSNRSPWIPFGCEHLSAAGAHRRPPSSASRLASRMCLPRTQRPWLTCLPDSHM